MKLSEAIARMEGFGADPSNLPTRHNNPGDIRAGQFANAHGAIPNAPDPRFKDAPGATLRPSPYAVFPTPEEGWGALRWLLIAHYSGMTVREAIAKYAPATENDTDRYVRLVCMWTGLKATDKLSAEVI